MGGNAALKRVVLVLVGTCVVGMAFGSNRVSKNSTVRAAYDDGLEQKDEGASSARQQSLQDTKVRAGITSGSLAAENPVNTSVRNTVRAAYDDGLEQDGEGLNSARQQGLDDNAVRVVIPIANGNRSSTLLGKSKAPNRLGNTTQHTVSKAADMQKTERAQAITHIVTGLGEETEIPDREVEEVSDYLLLGVNQVKKSQAVSIGDVDKNGFSDFVLPAPWEGNSSGAIRIMLMASESKVLLSRHLVPGKWGFTGDSLKHDDRFGASVLSAGDINGDGILDLVVGAPGDRTSGSPKGALYTFLLNDDATINRTSKISAATDSSLARQLLKNEHFGESLHPVSDLNGDGVDEVAVGSGDGSTTIVFLNQEGRAHTGVKFGVKAAMNIEALKFVPKKERRTVDVLSRLASTNIPGLSVRAADQCFFNDTHCACNTATEMSTCYDFEATELSSGRDVCIERECKPSLRCSCDGTDLCKRETETRDVFKSDESAGVKRAYCHKEKITASRAILLEGVPVPTESSLVVAGSTVFNGTHCSCVPKASVLESQTCLDFHHEVPGEAVICTLRECDISTDYICDLDGSSICARHEEMRTIFVNDGNTGKASQVYCHQQAANLEKIQCVDQCV